MFCVWLRHDFLPSSSHQTCIAIARRMCHSAKKLPRPPTLLVRCCASTVLCGICVYGSCVIREVSVAHGSPRYPSVKRTRACLLFCAVPKCVFCSLLTRTLPRTPSPSRRSSSSTFIHSLVHHDPDHVPGLQRPVRVRAHTHARDAATPCCCAPPHHTLAPPAPIFPTAPRLPSPLSSSMCCPTVLSNGELEPPTCTSALCLDDVGLFASGARLPNGLLTHLHSCTLLAVLHRPQPPPKPARFLHGHDYHHWCVDGVRVSVVLSVWCCAVACGTGCSSHAPALPPRSSPSPSPTTSIAPVLYTLHDWCVRVVCVRVVLCCHHVCGFA